MTAPDGLQWKFCSCDAYQQYAADPENYQHDPNDPCAIRIEKAIFYGPNGEVCSDYANQCHWNTYADRRNMRVKLRFAYFPDEGTGTIGILDSWRQRNSGRWIRAYKKLTIGVITGEWRTLECQFRAGISVPSKTRRSRSFAHGVRVGGHRTFRNDGITGNFSWNGGYSDQITLNYLVPGCWN